MQKNKNCSEEERYARFYKKNETTIHVSEISSKKILFYNLFNV